MFLLPLLFAALPSAQCSNIDADAVFHDQSPVYCSPLEPMPGDTVSLRLRAAHGDLTSATVRIWDTGLNGGAGGEVLVPMWVEGQVGPGNQFDMWRADIQVGTNHLWYRFRLEDSGCVDYYQITGVLDWATTSIPDFQIHPGFQGPPWARGAVGYQIFPDRFRNGDPSNDPQTGDWEYPSPGQFITGHSNWNATPTGGTDFFGGDLLGVWQGSDYLDWLGVEFIWFNPVFESRSNHRYDAVNYDHIDPALGSDSDFNLLVRGLKRKGIRVILDGVLNHCSSWSEWFDRYEQYPWTGAHENPATSPWGDWFTFLPGFNHISAPENYCSWFAINTLPKLNYSNPLVRDRMVRNPDSVLRGWLQTGISGWRLDAAEDVGPGCSGDDHSVWREMRDYIKQDDPNALLVLEEWSDASAWLYGDQFDGVMNFHGFLFPVQDYCLNRSISTQDFVERFTRGARAYPATANHSSWNQLGNHDLSRALTRANNQAPRLMEATFLQFTLPGTPVVYYGDEIGMVGGSDPDNRRTFDWNISNWNVPLARFTKRLAKLRAEHPALREGSFDPYWVHHAGRVMVFAREHTMETLIAVASSGDNHLDVTIPVGRYFPAGAVLEDLISGDTITVSANRTIDLSGAARLEAHGSRLYRAL
ncbi:MAG: glycoside hydrolase family 13 protein [Planctomycetes bacterium]|nr:glycoside hydrolase family 13 protein [Planctomycetota bacterium]MCP4862261.1 glycoside hydrolase family 13 protein [Planctomycetota bacterium]